MTTESPEVNFSQADALIAFNAWKCNCGPAALAAILGMRLFEVRPACEYVGFADKGYMSPTMMEAAIPLAGGHLVKKKVGGIRDQRCQPEHGLARIQWTGPWTAAGANPKWAYRQTHWIACWRVGGGLGGYTAIFDINGGIRPLLDWEREIVPLLVANTPRADGGWFITHSWEVERLVPAWGRTRR